MGGREPSDSDDHERYAMAFSASFMSDTKWRKIFGAIADADLRLSRATWKFIDSNHLSEWGVPDHRSQLMSNRLADGRFQPVEYKWIEWIHFPRTLQPIEHVGHPIEQDLEGLKRVLEATGKFHYLEDQQGITLFGYVQ